MSVERITSTNVTAVSIMCLVRGTIAVSISVLKAQKDGSVSRLSIMFTPYNFSKCSITDKNSVIDSCFENRHVIITKQEGVRYCTKYTFI